MQWAASNSITTYAMNFLCSAQILKKIFRRYIQNRITQKLSMTAKPYTTG